MERNSPRASNLDAYGSTAASQQSYRRPPGTILSPLGIAVGMVRDFQNAPDIPRPNTAQTFVPVVGPAWEAIADLQDGDYGGAAFNGAMAAADALPVARR